MIEMAGAYNEDENDNRMIILNREGIQREFSRIATKELQQTLKVALGKIESQNYNQRLGIGSFNKEQVNLFRKKCKNIKFRHIVFPGWRASWVQSISREARSCHLRNGKVP